MRMTLNAALCLLVGLCTGASVQAEGPTAGKGEGWDYVIAPYLWLAGASGDVSIGAIEASGKPDFGDLVNNIEGGGMGYFSARKGKWGVYVDVTSVKISTPGAAGAAVVTAETTTSFAEAGVLYRANESYWGPDGDPVSTDLFFGGRYLYLESDIKLAAGGNVPGYQDWFDPIFGATYSRGFTKKFTLTTSGDVGGIGIGSDFTWSAEVMGGYRMTPRSNFWFGYRYLDIDYDDGFGAGRFTFDVAIYGPILGASFHF